MGNEDCRYIRYKSGYAEYCLKKDHFIKSQFLIMTSFKQKTQKCYEAVGVFSEETLPSLLFVHTVMLFTEENVQYH